MTGHTYRDRMHEAIVEGDATAIVTATNRAVEAGEAPLDLSHEVLNPALKEVGDSFDSGHSFLPELIMSAEAMQAAVAILEPLLLERNEAIDSPGKVVIATPQGDIHDIGKNLVGMMLEGAGFEVHNLGINTDADEFIRALDEFKPDILGMSALLTTTMPYMKVVIDTLKSEGIRDNYIVMVGGAPLNDEFASAIGADAYCRDAATAVETAKKLISQRVQAA